MENEIGLTLFVFAQLHTPLMSGSNAVSGITIVGALLALRHLPPDSTATLVLGTLAVITATINVVGGYLVTDRMLNMFKSTKKEER
jgi:H+-translocating NAD(P) transhydrogenase subunit alpha